jgi:hypothetical protein
VRAGPGPAQCGQIVASNEPLNVVTEVGVVCESGPVAVNEPVIEAPSNALIVTVPAVIGGWLA